MRSGSWRIPPTLIRRNLSPCNTYNAPKIGFPLFYLFCLLLFVSWTFPYEKLKNVPVLVVHGDMDTVMVFDASKTMVDHAKAKGVNATWLPVAGGMHTDAWAQPEIISQIFDFFDKYKRK